MFFRVKESATKDPNQASGINYALIPVFRGKTRSAFGNQIVKVIKESKLCSGNRLVERLIIKNVEICCIVIETSGAQSLKIICASVPYMLNLLSRSNPKFKALIENEQFVPYIKFFQEIDFESLLSSLCTATIIIHKGVKKCYPVICVQLGRDAVLFGKNSLDYLWHLFLDCVVAAAHFICQDLPHLLQSLCVQNYTLAKYFAQNLPFIALGGAKHFVIFTLYIQRVTSACLKYLKKLIKIFGSTLMNISCKIDVKKIFEKISADLKYLFVFITSRRTYGKLKFIFLQLLNWSKPFFKKSIPIFWSELLTFIKKAIPIVKHFIKRVLLFLPALFKIMEENKDDMIKFYYRVEQMFKLILQYNKSFCLQMFEVLKLLSKYIAEVAYFILPLIIHSVSRIYYTYKYLLLDNTQTKKILPTVLLILKELYSMLYKLFLKACHILLVTCKFSGNFLRNDFPTLIPHAWNLSKLSLCSLQEFSHTAKPTIYEVCSTFSNCSEEVVSKCFLATQRVVPSMWCGLKVVTPVTIRASCEIIMTTKNSVTILYPELVKALVIVSPELGKGLVVILKDSGRAYSELTNVSQEIAQIAMCVSKQLPIVFKAVTEVTITTSGAMVEVLSTSTKAGNRVRKDVHNAVHTVSSAFNLVEIELFTTVHEISLEISSIISDSTEVRNVFILFAQTSRTVLIFTSEQYITALHDLSRVSLKAVAYSSSKIQNVFRRLNYIDIFIRNISELGYVLQKITSAKKLFASKITSTDSSVKIYEIIYTFLKNILSEIGSSTSDFVHQISSEVLNNANIITPKCWRVFKLTNAILWQHFCDSSSKLWTSLELTAESSWQLTCTYTPVMWNSFKNFSFMLWKLTCDKSPEIWDKVLVICPILWSSNCDVVQYIWEFHLNTCSSTWRVILPLSVASWECMLNTFPSTWLAFCDNSKYQWKNLCDGVEFSWNAVTQTSSLTWETFHKTVSNSWKHALRPLTTNTCYSASTALAKSIKLSYNTCAKYKKIMYFS